MSSDLTNGDASGREQPQDPSWADAGLNSRPMPLSTDTAQLPLPSREDQEVPVGASEEPQGPDEGPSGTPGPHVDENEMDQPTGGNGGAGEANGRAKTADTTELSETDPELELDDIPAPDDDSDFAVDETPLDSDGSDPLSDYDSDDSGRPRRYVHR
jgi:hypothetical protein